MPYPSLFPFCLTSGQADKNLGALSPTASSNHALKPSLQPQPLTTIKTQRQSPFVLSQFFQAISDQLERPVLLPPESFIMGIKNLFIHSWCVCVCVCVCICDDWFRNPNQILGGAPSQLCGLAIAPSHQDTGRRIPCNEDIIILVPRKKSASNSNLIN